MRYSTRTKPNISKIKRCFHFTITPQRPQKTKRRRARGTSARILRQPGVQFAALAARDRIPAAFGWSDTKLWNAQMKIIPDRCHFALDLHIEQSMHGGRGRRHPSERRKVIMNYLSPRRFRKMESDNRSMKEGWYAANKAGPICSGRFSDQAACQEHITKERTDIDAHHQGAVHNH
jgi:hypothetical protein